MVMFIFLKIICKRLYLYFIVDDESAVNPGIDHGSATSALEDDVVSTSDFGEFFFLKFKVREY